MCPRIRLLGHVVAAGRPVRRSLAIDGGDNNRSIDVSMLVSRHGRQYLPLLGTVDISSLTALSSTAAVVVLCMEHTRQEA